MQQVYQEIMIRRNNSPFTDAFITQQFLSGIVANSLRIDVYSLFFIQTLPWNELHDPFRTAFLTLWIHKETLNGSE